MTDSIRLDGRVAVITGAAGLIGAATMRLLAARGARIVAIDRREQDLNAAIAALPASAEPLAIAADVTDEAQVAAYVQRACDQFGTIDVFFNNAGIEGEIKSITDYPLEAFRRVLDVNVVGVFLGLKHVLPVMLQQNRGSIINTASIAGLIDSRMLSAIIEGRSGAPVPIDRIVDRVPARRLGQGSEVAAIVAFLASDDASYVSGAAYTVDGGRTAA